ncbi:MAG TPA: hypothetical protein VGI83_09015, partial [Gemmatimonadales bacterium]
DGEGATVPALALWGAGDASGLAPTDRRLAVRLPDDPAGRPPEQRRLVATITVAFLDSVLLDWDPTLSRLTTQLTAVGLTGPRAIRLHASPGQR